MGEQRAEALLLVGEDPFTGPAVAGDELGAECEQRRQIGSPIRGGGAHRAAPSSRGRIAAPFPAPSGKRVRPSA